MRYKRETLYTHTKPMNPQTASFNRSTKWINLWTDWPKKEDKFQHQEWNDITIDSTDIKRTRDYEQLYIDTLDSHERIQCLERHEQPKPIKKNYIWNSLLCIKETEFIV